MGFESQEKLNAPFAEKKEEKIFSEEEIKKINALPKRAFALAGKEKELEFLSGKKKKDAEKILADFEKERKELTNFTVEKVENLPNLKNIIESVGPVDMDIYELRGEYLDNFAKLKPAEQKKAGIAFKKQEDFTDYLQKSGIDILMAVEIFQKILEKKQRAEESSSFAKASADKPAEKNKPETPARMAAAEAPEIKKLDYEYFDPEEELEKISKFSGEEMKSLSAERRVRVKKERLKIFKEKLAEQKGGIAKINAELEEMVLDSGVVDRSKLEEYLAEQAKVYKLSPVELKKYGKVFDDIAGRNKIVNKFAEPFSRVGDKLIFLQMFGKLPSGEVKIKKGPLSFHVVCRLDDFAFLYQPDLYGKNPEKAQEKVMNVGGFCNADTRIYDLRKAITVGKSSYDFTEPFVETIRIHEEKHVFHDFIKPIEKMGEFAEWSGAEKKENDEKALREIMARDLLRNERRGKDEILAYFLTNRNEDIQGIKETLIKKEAQEGLYDYFEQDKKRYFDAGSGYAEFDKKLLEEANEKYKIKYEQSLMKALGAAAKLEDLGFAREKISGLFRAERLDKWEKVYERFKLSEEFKNQKETALKKLDEEIVEHKSVIDYIEKELEKLKNPSLMVLARKLLDKLSGKKQKTEEELEADRRDVLDGYEELVGKRKIYGKY